MPLDRQQNFCTSLNDGFTRECYCFKPLCNDMLDYSSSSRRPTAASAAAAAVVAGMAVNCIMF
jgi:hypothetical protein